MRRKSEDSKATPDKIKLDGVDHTIVVMSGKGGVGKSTVASNLALTLASENEHRVGLLDADMHGPDIPKILGIEDRGISGEQGVIEPESLGNIKITSVGLTIPDQDAPVIWRGPLKMKAIRQFLEEVNWGDLEYLIIDLPPGTGDEPLSISQLLQGIDGSIVVTTPQDVALLDTRKAVNFSKKLDIPVIGMVENMSGFVCPHCGERTDVFKTGGGEHAAAELGVPFLGRIPLDPRVVESGDSGFSLLEKYPDAEVSQAFSRIVRRCQEFLNPQG